MTSYLLDANVFIQAKNEYYGFDIVPAFWVWLVSANAAGTVFSIEKVGEELVGFGNELSEWAKGRDQAGGFFLPADEKVLKSLKDVRAGLKANPLRNPPSASFCRLLTTTWSLTPMRTDIPRSRRRSSNRQSHGRSRSPMHVKHWGSRG